MTQPTLQHGNYTGLGEAYSRYRPAYAENVLTALLALAGKPAAEIDAVDIGAGTGIWTRMLARAGCRSVIAVEPNNDIDSGLPIVRALLSSGMPVAAKRLACQMPAAIS